MSLKSQISPPLNAGPSIFDGHHLPSYVHTALEFAAKRLCRKGVPATLVVVRRDYQLPALDDYLTSASAVSSYIVQNHDRSCAAAASPTFSEQSAASHTTADSESFYARPQFSPPAWSVTTPPMTPGSTFTMASSAATTVSLSTATTAETGSVVSGIAGSETDFGIRLVHTGRLGLREERVLRQTFEKTARKYRIGTDWLSEPVSPQACGLTVDLMHRSVVQGDVLFSADGLVLVALDRLYTFKAALHSYARTRALHRLEDAVDELRRLVLASGRGRSCAVRKSGLVAAYPWIGAVDDAALGDVDRMYRRAYGGAGAIYDDVDVPAWAVSAAAVAAKSINRNSGHSHASQGSSCPCGRVGGRWVSMASASSVLKLDKPLPELPPTPPPLRESAASPAPPSFISRPPSRSQSRCQSRSQSRSRPRLSDLPEMRERERESASVSIREAETQFIGASPERKVSLVEVTSNSHLGMMVPPPSAVAAEFEFEVEFHPDDIENWYEPEDEKQQQQNKEKAKIVKEENDDDDAESWYREVPELSPAPAPPSPWEQEVAVVMAVPEEEESNFLPLLSPTCFSSSLSSTTSATSSVSASSSASASASSSSLLLPDIYRNGPRAKTAAAPLPKLQTTFARPQPRSISTSASAAAAADRKGDEDEEDEDLTARPKGGDTSAVSQVHSQDSHFFQNTSTENNNNDSNDNVCTAVAAAPPLPLPRWASMSIDEMLGPNGGNGGGARGSVAAAMALAIEDDRIGPLTPNGYDDISPITRGEWGFLMVGVGPNSGEREWSGRCWE